MDGKFGCPLVGAWRSPRFPEDRDQCPVLITASRGTELHGRDIAAASLQENRLPEGDVDEASCGASKCTSGDAALGLPLQKDGSLTGRLSRSVGPAGGG